MLRRTLLGIIVALLLPAMPGMAAQERSITVASTTSTEQSGRFRVLLPAFTSKSGIRVKVVAVGTGQALDIGRRGDADVVFVHDRAAEDKFMAEGQGVKRFDVMYNDFVVVGPKSDPAAIGGTSDVLSAFCKIAMAKAPFISRGDRSGTNAAELRHWGDAGINPVPGDGWYKEIGHSRNPCRGRRDVHRLDVGQLGDILAPGDRAWIFFSSPDEIAGFIKTEHSYRRRS